MYGFDFSACMARMHGHDKGSIHRHLELQQFKRCDFVTIAVLPEEVTPLRKMMWLLLILYTSLT